MDIDPEVAREAGRRVKSAGYSATVVAGDGARGWSAGGPYDRVQVSYAVSGIRADWLRQTRPGGVIVAPWRSGFVNHGAVVRLEVDGDGNASGRFTRPAEFMRDRRDRATVDHNDYVPTGSDGWPTGTLESRTRLTREDARDRTAEFVAGLLVPDVVSTTARHGELLTRWLYSRTDRSWAAVVWPDDGEGHVFQGGGPRRLWDEIERAFHRWHHAAHPPLTDLGLTITPNGTALWLHHPSHPAQP
ncbi:hypothetical protein LO762_08465 [Actinocorallia sp. API 0066]|nr:hypothetical protein [Actinocorallia sp. API 0066]